MKEASHQAVRQANKQDLSGMYLKELRHDILSHFCEVQKHLQIEESVKIIVYLR